MKKKRSQKTEQSLYTIVLEHPKNSNEKHKLFVQISTLLKVHFQEIIIVKVTGEIAFLITSNDARDISRTYAQAYFN